ncbi:Histone transcription regulator 3 [Pseudogymnoascus destructans]|uniref:Histone transcription regulator 3 homolog n=2 Tax=Pseudogymnoascus destructans TaxID=655981 RepID=L8FZ94_PSED2|nr:Histone transcription regulator 3 [Pseudogymnoascus destructans]ELR06157.1 hypothetical protein GMDG_07812 [Pseudogymnoascus destructans 20631-21]OAF56235.1 Histone transcription regulator 3 [Pseudogymnoascus destructans]
MSAFTALNVEPDENPEDDFDHTREIQLEEALKLYQNALKLHAQGPTYYEQAAEAYDKLFKSDVFKYPESLLDFTQDIPSVNLEPEPEPESPLEVAFAPTYDDGPSTLPQILYLAYKNHGQFIMDCLKHQMKIAPAMPLSGLAPQAQHALEQFTQALARDESDTELWRRAARVGELLGSNTISRYCLEAAVEVDDDPTLGEVDPGNPEEGFAGIQLKELLAVLSDNMALSHPVMAPYVRKHMPMKLKKYLDPYPFLSKLPARDDDDAASAATLEGPGLGEVKTFTWNSVAEAIGRIFDAYNGERGSALKLTGGESITLQLPEGDIEMIDPEVETQQLPDIAVTSSEITPPAADNRPGGQELQETTQDGNEVKAEEEESPPLTRKRSQSTAGLPETPEEEAGTQKRSKRIRNRDTLGGESALPADPNISLKCAYDAMCSGDQEMFSYIDGVLDKLNVKELGKASDIQALVDPDRPEVKSSVQNIAMRDLRDLIHKWDSALAAKFQSGNGLDIMGTAAGLQNNGLTAFLEHSKTESLKSQTQAEPTSAAGISTFAKLVNGNSLTIQEVAYQYFKAVCSSYITTLWPSTLKNENIKLMDTMDSVLYSQLDTEYQELQYKDVELADWEQLKEFAQMMLELHLDHYISIGRPQKADDDSACQTAKGRLDKWAMLTSDIMQGQPNDPDSEIVMRYLWASVLLANATEHVSREHMVLCWADLQSLLQKSETAKIELYNNVAMPEVSAAAADREISRLTTMDFFLNLFKDNSDPTAIIETLEPVIDDPTKISEDEEGDAAKEPAPEVVMSPATRDMRKFLENGTPSLRLYLWQRLREAYQEIEYPTRVFSCHLKCIEIIVEYLQSPTFSQIPQEARHAELLGCIKTIDELLVKALTLALNDQTAFEIVDESHLAASTTAIANLCRILHTGTLMEDQVTAGLVPDNTTVVSKEKGKPNQTLLKAFLLRLSEMAIRSWALLYTLVREGVSQNKGRFTAPDNDLSTYLATVLHTLGLRVRCERSNKIFLKMMKVELIRMKYVDKWEDYLGQVLWDLYGLRFGEKIGVFEIMDHGCDREKLDRRTAMSLVEYVVLLANRKSMRDLLRDELRSTIESMQQVLGAAKTNAQTSHNLRNITEYLKLSVSPLRLNKALKGMEYIDTLPVNTTESGLAEKGWYFLLGMISLSKFRAQKRTQAGATDDLKVAASFFRLQLQFTAEHWETWYRLAQCFDSELEEDVMWSTDKLNSDQAPLISEQRSAIHCYTMAVSTAMRTANPSFETAENMSDVFQDFGLRIYSSSRDPFRMEAFYMDDFERHMSGPSGMYKKNVHEELTRYKAWRFAAELFKRAIAKKPNNWMSHYMLGKCYWKMFTRVEDEPDARARAGRPTVAALVQVLERAIETVPKPRDSRSDPTLEPHYKIVTVMHKLVQFRQIDAQEAANILQRQHYPIKKGEQVVITDDASWEAYIVECVRHLRNLDRSNWQHRFIARSAHLIYDNNEQGNAVILATRAELSMSIFTKTMVVNVWKPENERPGRHCVYMSKYVLWMVHLLAQLDDRASMEMLTKRVRKKQMEYYHFNEVWTACCLAYCKLIRRAGKIDLNQDELVRSLPPEDFEEMATDLELWVDNLHTPHASFDHLRESLDLKKLNGNLMKAMPIDDLIVDIYSSLIWEVGRHLTKERRVREAAEAAARPPVVEAPQRQDPMSMNNLINNTDSSVTPMQGVIESAPKPKPKPPGRREILRRAEVLANRGHEVKEKEKEKEKEKPAGKAESHRLSDLQNLLRRRSRDKPSRSAEKDEGSNQGHQEDHDDDDCEGGDADGEGGSKGNGDEDAHSSPPGSVHDSADDESDLSDAPGPVERMPQPSINGWHSEAQDAGREARGG